MGELVKYEGFEIADPKIIKENISENFEGLTPSFITIKMPTGGSTTFEVDEEAVKSVEGIIVDHYAIRMLYMEKFGAGEKHPPVCKSINGMEGQGICEENGEDSCLCVDCDYNQWGSFKKFIDNADDSNKKACQEKHRIFILRSGELLPVLLPLPATSLEPLKLYMTKIAQKGKHYSTVITKISLEKVTSKGGLNYAKAVFQKLGDVPEDKTKEIISLKKFLKPYCRNKPIEAQEATGEEAF